MSPEPPPWPRPRVAALVAALAVLALRFNPVYDPDAFWHLATGRWIIAHRAIPRVDVFSHTALGRPLRFVDALADCALYAAWSLGGYGALALLTGALGALTVAISLRHKRFDVAMATASPLVAAVLFRVTPRPQTFALPCFAALLAVLDAATRDARWLRAAPLIVALWQNLHPSAPLGVAAVGLAATAETLRRRRDADRRATLAPWWSCAGLSALALLLTPRPIERIAAGFTHVSDVNMAELITEWAPLLRFDATTSYALGFYALIALALVGGARALRDPARRFELPALAALLTVQGFRAVRFVPFAALALAPLALRGAEALLDLARPRRRVALAALTALALGALTVAPQGHGWGAGVSSAYLPVGAAEFLNAQRVSGRLLNEFTFGGYLIWTVGPRCPVSLDGRSMALYDPRFVDAALRARAPALQRFVRDHDVSVIVHRTSSLLTWAASMPGWSVVYFDDTAFIAVRDADHPTLARAHGYRALRPGDWAAVVPALRADPSLAALARAELARAAPSALARVLEGAVALGVGDHAAAERAFRRALAILPSSVPARRGLLMSCALRGDAACVCARARDVLSRAPTNRYARELSRRFGCDAIPQDLPVITR